MTKQVTITYAMFCAISRAYNNAEFRLRLEYRDPAEAAKLKSDARLLKNIMDQWNGEAAAH